MHFVCSFYEKKIIVILIFNYYEQPFLIYFLEFIYFTFYNTLLESFNVFSTGNHFRFCLIFIKKYNQAGFFKKLKPVQSN